MNKFVLMILAFFCVLGFSSVTTYAYVDNDEYKYPLHAYEDFEQYNIYGNSMVVITPYYDNGPDDYAYYEYFLSIENPQNSISYLKINPDGSESLAIVMCSRYKYFYRAVKYVNGVPIVHSFYEYEHTNNSLSWIPSFQVKAISSLFGERSKNINIPYTLDEGVYDSLITELEQTGTILNFGSDVIVPGGSVGDSGAFYDESIPDFKGRAEQHRVNIVSDTYMPDGYIFTYNPYDPRYVLEVKMTYSYKYGNDYKTNTLMYIDAKNDPLYPASVGRLEVYGQPVKDFVLNHDPYYKLAKEQENNASIFSDFVQWWINLFKGDDIVVNPHTVSVRLATYENGIKKVGRWTQYSRTNQGIMEDILNVGSGGVTSGEWNEGTIGSGTTDYKTDADGNIVVDDANVGESITTPDKIPDAELDEVYDYEGNVKNDFMNTEGFFGTMEEFYSFLKNSGSLLGQLPKLLGELFSFLPSVLIAFITVGLGLVVVCRFLGR